MIGRKKIESHKNISLNKKITEYKDMNKVYIPLVSYNSPNCKPTCTKGDKVLVGTVVAKRSDDIKMPIHSSVSGEVLDIEEKLYLNGEKAKCIVIQNDFEYKEIEIEETKNIEDISREDLEEKLRKCGIIGMGGSGFPTYIKYNKDAKIKYLIVNAVECEPYITTDHELIINYLNEVLEALKALYKILNLKEIIIATKTSNKEVNEKIEKAISKIKFINLKKIKNYYPAGWERYLIKETLDKTYKKLPIEKNIVVSNIATIYSMYDALKYNKPVVKRIITVTGENVNDPRNIMVRTGTEIKEVLSYLNGYLKTDSTFLISGGPLMGKALENDDLVMSLNLNCVLIKDTKEEVQTTCMRCGKCTFICPTKLSPVLMRNNKNENELKKLHPEKCIECGLCSYICPAKLELREEVKQAKKIISRWYNG